MARVLSLPRGSGMARIGVMAALGLAVGLGTGVVVAAVSPLYAAAGLLAIGLGLAILSNIKVGLMAVLAVLFLLPFGVIPLSVGGVRLTLLDVALTACLLVWLMRMFAKRESFAPSFINAPVIALLGISAVALVNGLANYTSPEALRLYLKIVNSILLFFIVLNCIRDQQTYEQLVVAMIAGGTIAATIALALYVIPKESAIRALSALGRLGYPTDEGMLRYIAETEVLRAIGTAVDPNVLGATLMVTTLLAATQFFSSSPILNKRLLMPAGGIMLAALLLTFSRSAWLGLAGGLFLVATVKDRRLWLLFILIGLALFLNLVPGAEKFVGHLQSGLLAQDKAAAMRLGEYKDALILISRHPWFGVGFGAAPSVELYVGVSSVYLQMAEHIGLIGLAIFIITMATLFYRGLITLGTITNPRLQGITLSFLAVAAGMLTTGLFDHHFFNIRFPHMAALFWLSIALAVVGLRLGQKTEEDT